MGLLMTEKLRRIEMCAARPSCAGVRCRILGGSSWMLGYRPEWQFRLDRRIEFGGLRLVR